MKKNYDAIIIGGGIGGLFAGAMLGQDGMKTAIIEKNKELGGYFSSFRTPEGDILDYGANYLLACDEGGEVHRILKTLDMEDKIRFVSLAFSDRIIFRDRTFTFPKGLDALRDALIREFPESEAEIEDYIDWMKQYADCGSTRSAESGRFFMKYYKQTYKEFLETRISSPLLRAVLSIRIQENPGSLMMMGGVVSESYGKGMNYPMGGSSKICTALTDKIRACGGEIIPETVCTQITEEQDGSFTVTLKTNGEQSECAAFYIVYDGDPFRLNALFSDAAETYKEEKINQRKIGHSSLSVYLTAKNLDLSSCQCGRIYLCETEDVFRAYKELETGILPESPILKVHIPSVYDSSLTGEGRAVVRIETDVYHVNSSNTQEDYLQYAEKIIDIVQEKLFPDLKSKIVFLKVMTPIDFEERFLSKAGSGTGWRHNVENYMLKPFPQGADRKNVYTVGQWGSQGSGIRQVAVSAEKVSKEIFGKWRKR